MLPPQTYASSFSVSDAFVLDNWIAVSMHVGVRFEIHVFELNPMELVLSHKQSFNVDGEVTCLSLSPGYGLLAGISQDGLPILGRCPLSEGSELQMISLRGRESSMFSPYKQEGINAQCH
jgi:hypothetical protein